MNLLTAFGLIAVTSDAGVLRLGESQPLVYAGVCRRLCFGFGVRISPGSLAIWTRRGCVVARRRPALVAGTESSRIEHASFPS